MDLPGPSKKKTTILQYCLQTLGHSEFPVERRNPYRIKILRPQGNMCRLSYGHNNIIHICHHHYIITIPSSSSPPYLLSSPSSSCMSVSVCVSPKMKENNSWKNCHRLSNYVCMASWFSFFSCWLLSVHHARRGKGRSLTQAARRKSRCVNAKTT